MELEQLLNDVNLPERLKKFRFKTGIKIPQIARETGIPKENLYKWIKGTKPSDFGELLLLVRYMDRREQGLLVDDPVEEMEKEAPMLIPTADISIDDLFGGSVKYFIEVIGESMEPIFKNGCKLAIIELKNKTLINGGDYYCIVDENQQCIIRRVYLLEQSVGVRLVAENSDKDRYPTMFKEWAEIKAIFRVIGNVSKY